MTKIEINVAAKRKDTRVKFSVEDKNSFGLEAGVYTATYAGLIKRAYEQRLNNLDKQIEALKVLAGDKYYY